MYKLELEELRRWIAKNNIRKVLVQAPFGLRSLIPEISKYLEEMNVEMVVSTSNTWGGCDRSKRSIKTWSRRTHTYGSLSNVTDI
ncbi:MAG: hypothetical protein QXP74_01660 [Nitrososphaerota archaeon]